MTRDVCSRRIGMTSSRRNFFARWALAPPREWPHLALGETPCRSGLCRQVSSGRTPLDSSPGQQRECLWSLRQGGSGHPVRHRHGEPVSIREVRRSGRTDRALPPGETGACALCLRVDRNSAGRSLRLCRERAAIDSGGTDVRAVEDYARALGSEVVSVPLDHGLRP